MQFCHYCPWTLNFTVEMFHLPVCMTMHANCTSNSFLQPNECVGFTDLQAFLFACAAFVFCLRTSPSRWPVFLMIWPSVPACSRASICIESRNQDIYACHVSTEHSSFHDDRQGHWMKSTVIIITRALTLYWLRFLSANSSGTALQNCVHPNECVLFIAPLYLATQLNYKSDRRNVQGCWY